MGKALELITGRVVAPSTTLTAWTVNTGNSLEIRNAVEGTKVQLLDVWNDNQVAGVLRIRSPRLHDNTQGIRLQAVENNVTSRVPKGAVQELFPQDTLIVEQSGSGTAGDIETGALLVGYEDLPGIEGRFITPSELKDRLVDLVGVENTLSLGTSGDYTGEEALNAEFDLLKANTDYALLGIGVNLPCLCIRYRASEFGNLGLGVPAQHTLGHITGNYFVRLSELYDSAWIPVFNSANVGNVLVDGVQDENGTDVTVSTILAELS